MRRIHSRSCSVRSSSTISRNMVTDIALRRKDWELGIDHGSDLTNVQFSMLNSYPKKPAATIKRVPSDKNWEFGFRYWSDLLLPAPDDDRYNPVFISTGTTHGSCGT